MSAGIIIGIVLLLIVIIIIIAVVASKGKSSSPKDSPEPASEEEPAPEDSPEPAPEPTPVPSSPAPTPVPSSPAPSSITANAGPAPAPAPTAPPTPDIDLILYGSGTAAKPAGYSLKLFIVDSDWEYGTTIREKDPDGGLNIGWKANGVNKRLLYIYTGTTPVNSSYSNSPTDRNNAYNAILAEINKKYGTNYKS
jgi:hypothetical protein